MIIAFSNQKGGVGKTTTTLNLGFELANAGRKVLLVDLDPQANLTSGLGCEITDEQPSIYDVLLEKSKLSEAIVQVEGSSLQILPATIDLAGAEVELVNTISREAILKRVLEEGKNDFDYIMIDCPPSLGMLTINALVAADKVIIPVQSEYFALEGLSQLLKTINLIKSRLNPKLDILGIAITMYDSRTNLSKQVAQELANTFGNKLFETIIPRSIRLSEAPSHGKAIRAYDATSPGAKSYNLLARELLERTQ